MRGTRQSLARVLITGGSGFIGRSLVQSFIADGWDVTIADIRSVENAPSIVGDLRDPTVQRRAVSPGIDVVVHLAAVTSVVGTVDDPRGAYQTNVEVTADLLELSREHGVQAFLLASTNAVVGNVGELPINEDTPLRPLTPYGATKAAAEMLLIGYAASYGLAGCALRLGNVVGPGMHAKDSLFPRLLRAARAGTGIDVYGDGSQVRDLVSVDDVVRGFRIALGSGHIGPLVIGSGRSVSVNELIETARDVTGALIPVRNLAARPVEMPAVVLDISLARKLGYQPQADLLTTINDAWHEFCGDSRWPRMRGSRL